MGSSSSKSSRVKAARMDEICEGLNGLSIAPASIQPRRTRLSPHSSQAPFVGGFAPVRRGSPALPEPYIPTPTRSPVMMPEPILDLSKTMQRVLYPFEESYAPPPTSQAELAVPKPKLARPKSDSPTTRRTKTAPRPSQARAISEPVSSVSETPDLDRCQGFTQAAGNPRCKRRRPKVRKTDADHAVLFYCANHRAGILKAPGFYSTRQREIFIKSDHADDGYVLFDHWIAPYLSDETKRELRAEMRKPADDTEEDGYIYAFEIRDPEERDIVSLKIGRTTNLYKRLVEWSNKCPSQTLVFRGSWPGKLDQNVDHRGFIAAGFAPGDKGSNIHRLERLVHLHLADLVVHGQHLHPDFPNVSFDDIVLTTPKSSTSTAKKHALKEMRRLKEPCKDCGTCHQEIFNVLRVLGGDFEGLEFESIIDPIIQHWGEFVTKYT